MSKKSIFKLSVLAILFLTTIFSIYTLWKEDRKEILTVTFLDVGQGDAIFIDAPNGNQILIDAGRGRSVLRELGKVLPFYDKDIDVLLITHPDADHIGGMVDVLERYRTSIFIQPGVGGETSVYEELQESVASKKLKVIEARKDMRINLGRGVVLEILFPDRDPIGMESNSASIVARLVYGEIEFMLTGDSPSSIEGYLTRAISVESLRSDVLKAGHHGSKTSSSQAFVSAVDPEFVVISSGKDNRYGHPHKEVLDTFENFGAEVLQTSQSGRIVFKTDGVGLEVR